MVNPNTSIFLSEQDGLVKSVVPVEVLSAEGIEEVDADGAGVSLHGTVPPETYMLIVEKQTDAPTCVVGYVVKEQTMNLQFANPWRYVDVITLHGKLLRNYTVVLLA